MAIGDQNNILARLISYLPRSWFDRDSNPVRDAILSGLAGTHVFIYSLLAYVRPQTRIKTATDGFLDLVSQDYFGGDLPRLTDENDAHFLKRIIVYLLRERATRRGLAEMLEDLTGFAPVIIEPLDPGDCGAYSAPNSGYGSAGAYGSMLLPYQGFVQAFRPGTSGVPNVAGYGVATAGLSGVCILFDDIPVDPLLIAPGGYGAGRIEYASPGMVGGAVTDADIYAAVTSVIPEGTIAWVEIGNRQ